MMWINALMLNKNIFFRRTLITALMIVSTNLPAGEHAPLPVMDKNIHNGVATCAGSMCHGAVKPHKQTRIQHNEYIIWDRRDIHSRAYNRMFNDNFREITDKLGMKAPHEEPVCLACHASDIPEQYRGKKFQMSDGIGCETCHGGSEKWLKSHTDKKATHADNLANGLYPTDDIVARARLCLSCHYGNENQFVTHEIMGAGHPRISFELDTFTELQPMHYTQDDDYAKRKTPYTNIKAWAVGQALATESVLKMITSDAFHPRGLFPELSMFDCYSCHHPMSQKTWTPRKGTGLKPGAVPLNDASLLMLRHVVAAMDKAKGWRFKKQTKALQGATAKNHDAFRQQAQLILDEMPKIIQDIVAHEFTATDIQTITMSILNEGIWEGYTDYVAGEQCVMALSVLTITWDKMHAFGEPMGNSINAEIDRMYDLVEDDEAYDYKRFRQSLESMRSKISKLSQQ